MIILIDNYDSFTWNLYHYLGDLGAETVVHRNDKISVGQVMSARPEAIVISPGPGTPSQAGIIIDLVKEAAGKIPFSASASACKPSAKPLAATWCARPPRCMARFPPFTMATRRVQGPDPGLCRHALSLPRG